MTREERKQLNPQVLALKQASLARTIELLQARHERCGFIAVPSPRGSMYPRVSELRIKTGQRAQDSAR